MKKIFFEDRYITITDHVSEIPKPECPTFDVESEAEVKAFLKLFLQDDRPCYQMIVDDEDLFFQLLKRNFKVVEAAGGAVCNEYGELLVIERFGKWDLPKGHLEKGEKSKEGAIREVEEECGVSDLNLEKKLCTTWHCFPKKGKMVLKKTYWYFMSLDGRPNLIPQTEEGITKAEWKKISDLKGVKKNTWASLLDVFEGAEEEI